MKANDIRIGNIVNFREGLTRIRPGIAEFEIDHFYWWQECNPGAEEICDGVPLTEKWMLRFGFEKLHDMYAIGDDNHRIIIEEQDGKFVYGITSGQLRNWGRFLPHVHELQNLVNGLTGLDLPVAEEVEEMR